MLSRFPLGKNSQSTPLAVWETTSPTSMSTPVRYRYGTAGLVQVEDSLDGEVHGGSVEGLEHDLSHLLSVALGVERSISQKDRALNYQIEQKIRDRQQILPPPGSHGAL